MEMCDKILPLWISTNGQQYSQKIAIIDSSTTITYCELADYIDRLAGWLVFRGVQRGDRVVLLLQNTSEFVISFFAIARIGAVAVPLNVQYKEHELIDYFRDSDPKVAIVSSQVIPLIKEVTSVVRNKRCEIIGVPDGMNEAFSFKRVIEENIRLNRSVDLYQETETLCQYSSGSTGKPKKIVRTHFNLVSEAENFNSTVHITNGDVILCVVPLFHAHGFGNCMLASIYAGATLVLLEGFIRNKVLQTIQDKRVTVFPGVPFIFSILADTPLKDKMALSSLRLCFSAGAALPHETFQKFYEKYGIPIRQLYGSTETGSVSINLGKDISTITDSVGLPMNNVEVEIFGKNGEILPPNETGEIGIKSPAMINAYAGFENSSKESFRNGYFFPLDLGKKDNRGNIFITGRKSLFINTGGNKVDPSEIETLLSSYPKIREVAVVGTKGYYGEDVIKAVVVPNSPCDEREIVEYCKGKIAEFKIPRIVEFREELPKSPMGKILRKYLC